MLEEELQFRLLIGYGSLKMRMRGGRKIDRQKSKSFVTDWQSFGEGHKRKEFTI